MREQEIRTDFARRLVRLFEAMQVSAQCVCAAQGNEHRTNCPAYQWGAATRIIQMVLEEENGADGG